MTDAQRQACEELIRLQKSTKPSKCIRYIAHAANHAAEIARALLDTAAAPAWHDAPTGPGLWAYVTTGGDFGFWTVRADDQTFPTGRFYGPIPEDQP